MKQIAQWHKETFETDRKAQERKLLEEKDEASRTRNYSEWYKEMADVVFVLAALIHRFESPMAKIQFEELWSVLNEIQKVEIEKELRMKFEINKNRIWERRDDGTYHHI